MMSCRTGTARALIILAAVLLAGPLWAQDESNRQEKKGPCARTLSQCTLGCDAEPDSPKALINTIKRTLPTARTPKKLTLDDFLTLQDQATNLVGQKRNLELDEGARAKLRGLKVNSADIGVSEGDLVELSGYLIGLPNRPKASGPESVNCRLSGSANNDFHIPVGTDPDSTEFEGIVVEMIPQDRNPGWTVKKLKRTAREQRPIIVRGQLFYDNPHLVNDDPDEEIGGQPKRASLWEIHPVTDMFVCMAANRKCTSSNVDTQQWMKLEQLKD